MVAGLVLAVPASGADVAGVNFPESVRTDGAELVLNGAGLRQRFVFDVYAMGLYLAQEHKEAADAVAAPGPKRVQIHMLRDVGADQFTQALVDGLRANHGEAQFRALEPRVQQLSAVMAQVGEAKKGMRIALDWTGGETRVLVEGKPAGAGIPGEDFYRALLRIWLGDQPVQDDLKKQLLRQPG
jgi:hypothetical protein